jgi:hypothetical protein
VLTPAQYSGLADVPSELEWLANITNPKTRRAYKNPRSPIADKAVDYPGRAAQPAAVTPGLQ